MNTQVIKEAKFDEVFDSQKNFRVLADAMSQPGKVYKLHQHNFESSPQGFNPYVLTILKSLCDNNVSICNCILGHPDYLEYLLVNTGALSSSLVEDSDYAVFDGSEYSSDFMNLKPGILDFPEDSATAVICVESLSSGSPVSNFSNKKIIHLKGPGIKNINTLNIAGLDINYPHEFSELNQFFPLGIDLIFVDLHGNVSCMTRTTKLEVE